MHQRSLFGWGGVGGGVVCLGDMGGLREVAGVITSGAMVPVTPAHGPGAPFLTAAAGFNGIYNRRQPPPTASANSSNRLPNRFWNPL